MAKKSEKKFCRVFDPPGTISRDLLERLAPSNFELIKWPKKNKK